MRNTQDKVVDNSQSSGQIDARLCGFKINSHLLHSKHKEWLEEYVVPILADGGSVSLIGQASRSGRSSHNQALSRLRAKAVESFLKQKTSSAINFCHQEGAVGITKGGSGETAAASLGQKDGSEDAFFRAVVISAWCKSNPPRIIDNKHKKAVNVERKIQYKVENLMEREPDQGTMHDGSDGVALANLLKGLYRTGTLGDLGEWKSSQYPPSYVVHMVVENEEIDDRDARGVLMLKISKQIDYVWGPPNRNPIRYKKVKKLIKTDGTKSVDSYEKLIPREKIWSEVRSPR